ncbi:MAG: hypothetical protein LBR11_08225 [Deltaproteobacteria bacterium]|jgi:hypothetical protein|nr:hypothetical protein [Deltaproteobacteria bacterium]
MSRYGISPGWPTGLSKEQEEKRRKEFDEEVLNHPDIKPLVDSGEWDKMTPMHQKWLLLDLIPWSQKAIENSIKMCDQIDADFNKHIINDGLDDDD